MTRISDHIDGQRLWNRLMQLARFGALPGGGVNRQALSTEESAARAQLFQWGRKIGLLPATDDAANLFLRLRGRDDTLPPVLIGSHIDSQPSGGKFDGAYGVLAALETVQAIIDAGARPLRPIEVAAWMNEEGSRFAPGLMGSAAFTGKRGLEDITKLADKAGVSVAQELARMAKEERDLPRRPLGFPVTAFIEAHIEQGLLLQEANTTIGVVTGIQGKRAFRIEVVGRESHSGATPRRERRDALVSAVRIVDALQNAMWDEADTVRFTIGLFNVMPGAPSVVPGRVLFSIDLRHHDPDVVKTLGDRIPGICEEQRGRCEVVVRELLYDVPLHFPQAVRDAIAGAAGRLGLSHMEMPSPAGHDARYLHYVCPTGMIFIPCKDGISHNEDESITLEHAAAGARVLADVAFDLAERP